MNTDTYELKISTFAIQVTRKDIKNMHLSVNPPNGHIKLAAPLHTDAEVVRLFAISKLGWIKKQVNAFQEQEREAPRDYVTGESHYVQGKRYLLKVIEYDGKPKIAIQGTKHLVMYVRKGTNKEQKANLLREWYRKQLKKQIEPLLVYWQSKLGVEVNDWGVKQMKTKWGSCNTDAKRIWLNLELAKKPPICLEYILVHELVHLHERHHNDRFVKLMDTYMPNWRLHRDLLNSLPVVHNDWGY